MRIVTFSFVLATLLVVVACDDGTPVAVEPVFDEVSESDRGAGVAMAAARKPTNLTEAIDVAEEWLREDETTAQFREGEPIDYHHGLGTYMRNEWGLWADTELSRWFRARGVEHPDDMSMVVLEGLHRRVNGEDVNEAELLAR